ncbi:MAG: replication initiator protein A [Pseudomonadota bacterium]
MKPSADGLATIHDRDVLIYCISQLVSALNQGQKISRTLKLKAFDLLRATNRVTDGRGYVGLRAALARLQGTQIETNIVTGGKEQIDIFSVIDRARIVRETRDGRMLEVEVTLSDWVFNAIEHQEVLTLHRDYFRLRKPLERRMYELARKHCGRQTQWVISLPVLQGRDAGSSNVEETTSAFTWR